MLLDGVNHVAILTGDTERFHDFYREVFDAKILQDGPAGPGMRLSFVEIGGGRDLNVFEIEGGDGPAHTPMFGRGPIDHLGLQATSIEAFNEIRRRLMARGATDGFVTDFGAIYSLFFVDPDGLECEVCVPNPSAQPGVTNPPGTPAPGYEVGVP